MKKRIVSSIMCLAMLLSLLPATAFAIQGDNEANTNATPNYTITGGYANEIRNIKKATGLADGNVQTETMWVKLEASPVKETHFWMTVTSPDGKNTVGCAFDGTELEKDDGSKVLANCFAFSFNNKAQMELWPDGLATGKTAFLGNCTVKVYSVNDDVWNDNTISNEYKFTTDPAGTDSGTDLTYTLIETLTIEVTQKDNPISDVVATLITDKTSYDKAPSAWKDLNPWDDSRDAATVVADTDMPNIALTYDRGTAGDVKFTAQRETTTDGATTWTNVPITGGEFTANAENANAAFGFALAKFTNADEVTSSAYLYEDYASIVPGTYRFGVQLGSDDPVVYSNEIEISAQPTYKIPDVEVKAPDGTVMGTVKANKATGVNKGETITVTVTPAQHYQLATGASAVTYKFLTQTVNLALKENKYTFCMPGADVTLNAQFVPDIANVTATATTGVVTDLKAEFNGEKIVVSGIAQANNAVVAVKYTPANGAEQTIDVAYNSDTEAFKATPEKVTVGGTEYPVDVTGLTLAKDLGSGVELVPPTVEAVSTVVSSDANVTSAATNAVTAITTHGAVAEGLMTTVNNTVDTTNNGDIKLGNETIASKDNIEAAKSELTVSSGDTVTTYVVPYLDVKVVGAEADSSSTSSLTFDITPMVAVKVSTAANAASMTDSNTKVVTGSEKKVAVNEAVTVTLSIPASFEPKAALHFGNDDDTVTERLPVSVDTVANKATFVAGSFSKYKLTTEEQSITVVYKVAGQADETATFKLSELTGTSALAASTNGWATTANGTKKYDSGAQVTTDLFNMLYQDAVDSSGVMTVTLYAASAGSQTTPGGSSGGSASSNLSIPSATGGKVTASPTSPKAGDKVTLTVTADSGKYLSSIIVSDKDGKDVEVTRVDETHYTFTMPEGKVTVKATFTDDTSTTEDFTDVDPNAYYADAVKWAVDKGITNGLTATTFGPNNSCTRGQMVTFLWRAAGSPAASGTNSFTDVASGEYYYDAVLWAVEKGITNGTSATTFSPNATVNRGQTVTFLYRYAESPAATGESSFTDVASGAFYADAVKWAVAEGITNGTSATTFAPASNCTRGQIVTFMYRQMAE